MVKIFKKKEEKKILPEEGKVQLADASRRLGFEVGYHRHSEIGWVQEKLSQIYKFAEEYELRDFVKEQYNGGKEEGSKVKERDTKSGLSQKSSSNEVEQPSAISIDRTKKDRTTSNIGSGYKSSNVVFSGSSDMIRQPGLVDLPENVERPKSIDRPSFLDGARHLTPKKK
ncbi:hypothetical protein [Methanolobus sp. ZRKC5]|uniref:hypothetical protein n=1 Tax=unclassified Methanolobus TaxID=2629569 RepID=UPI00313DB3C9